MDMNFSEENHDTKTLLKVIGAFWNVEKSLPLPTIRKFCSLCIQGVMASSGRTVKWLRCLSWPSRWGGGGPCALTIGQGRDTAYLSCS
eukprot:6487284-Amphidinium_carterae.1